MVNILIKDLRSELGRIDYSDKTFEEIFDIKLSKSRSIIPSFKGFFEGKNFVDRLFREVFCVQYKDFNIYNGKKMITLFEVLDGNERYWYLYGTGLGFIKSSTEAILSMINNGWETRSNSLLDEIDANYSL